MPHPFVDATTWQRDGATAGALRFDEGWYQGRGAYGGVVAGALARAMAEVDASPDRPLRWLTVHFCAPAVGVGRIEVTPERRGNAVSHASARLTGEGGTLATASATFARARPAELAWRDAQMPAVAPPASIPEPFRGTPSPVFTRHLEFRFVHGAMPFTAAPAAELGAWIRFVEPLVVDPIAAIALLDAAPPAAMARMDRPRPMASVAFSVQIFADLPRPGARADEHHLLVGRSRIAGGGYAEEMAELWSEGGELIAACWQNIAVLG